MIRKNLPFVAFGLLFLAHRICHAEDCPASLNEAVAKPDASTRDGYTCSQNADMAVGAEYTPLLDGARPP
jgi:hypothetical protein